MATTKDEDYMTFEQWTIEYNKKYDSQTVKDERKTLWEQNLEFVKQHNAEYLNGKHSYRIQQTRCSDQTLEELSWMSCTVLRVLAGAGLDGGGGEDPNPGNTDEPNPESVDWRERGCVTPVRDQDPLPACWIFAAVSAVESHNAIKNGKLVELSVQQLVDCIFRGDKEGPVETALDYIAVYGSISEKDYPQSKPFKMGPKCLAEEMAEKKKVAVKLDRQRYVHVGKSEEELETAVAHKGPIAVTLALFNQAQVNKLASLDYEDIFYDPHPEEKKEEKYHSVLVVGYGSQRNKMTNEIEKYWIIKNSWGCDSSNKVSGFQKIAKDRGNHCMIASYAVYPVM